MEPVNPLLICPFCGHLSRMIWVHGHGQCAVCGTTIDECCRGEQSDCNIEEQVKKNTPKPKVVKPKNNHEQA